MPDYLKEMRSAIAEGVAHLIAKEARQRGISGGPPGRVFGSDQPYGGGNGYDDQNFFTTGYNAGTKQTTVPMLLDFSTLDGTDILTS